MRKKLDAAQVAQIQNEARLAHHLAEGLKPFMKQKVEETLIELKNLYRTGDYDLPKLVGLVAKLCAYEDMENSLLQKVRRAETTEG